MAEPRHELTDVRVGLLAKIGLAGIVLTILTLFAVLVLFRSVVSREAALEVPRSPLAASPTTYGGPRLQVSPPEELSEVRAAEREILSGFGWVDREAGVVRIPVDLAIELLAERGLPSREETSP